jgi:hypothetical protein
MWLASNAAVIIENATAATRDDLPQPNRVVEGKR